MRARTSMKLFCKHRWKFLALATVCVLISWHLSYPYFHDVVARRVLLKEDLLKNVPASNSEDGSCLLQKYDIYDPSIAEYINEAPYKLDCSRSQPYFTFLDWNGNLHLNDTEFRKGEYKSVECTYQRVIRRSDNEFEVEYGQPIPIITPSTAINESAIKVTCEWSGVSLYSTVHSHILKPSDNRISKNKSLPKHRPSVFILAIDSMSRGHFLRALPLTFKLLSDKGMIVMEGLNKVGDNTFRNMLPMLTGLRYDQDMLEVPSIPQRQFLAHEENVVHFDDDPIIWKYFAEQGYFTMHGEEYVTPLFDFEDGQRSFEGFRREPVDYYFRPAYVALTENCWNIFNALNFRRRYCIGNEPSYRYLLNYTEEFLTKMSGLKYFALPFFVEHSHEYLNDIKNLDGDFADFLSRSFERGLLRDAIVIVMGDHGHRFSGIRSTSIGRLEERMPFFGILLPMKLRQLYPHIKEGLMSNRNVLLSWFDIYSTLLDVLHDDFDPVPKRKRVAGEIGSSIFRPIPKNRKCVNIGIPQVYCMCGTEKSLNTGSKIIRNAALSVVSHLNHLLSTAGVIAESNIDKSTRNKTEEKCSNLRLSNIHSASLMASSDIFVNGESSVNIRVMISTLPGEAKFEGAIEYKGEDEDMVVFGDVNRVNKYGDQSLCVSDSILKLYCYCV